MLIYSVFMIFDRMLYATGLLEDFLIGRSSVFFISLDPAKIEILYNTYINYEFL